MNCQPWTNANDATCDYYHECSGSWLSDVPLNYVGWQEPHGGDAYAGMWLKAFTGSNPYFEYLEAPLTSALQAGKAYHVEMYVSLPGRFCGIDQIGAYFHDGAIHAIGWGAFNFVPQVESNIGFLNDTVNWMLVEGCFIAEGGEDHMIIGNFHDFASTPLDTLCMAVNDTQSYYFIDDVSVTEIMLSGLTVELGNDVTVCFQHTIDPGISGVNFLWSDGSTGPTLTVDASGMYALTIYDGCVAGTDSVEVTVTNQPGINLNPNFATICPGQTLVVSLDPVAGTYLWQDGSAASHYVISTEGIYSVTFNDGCDLTSDQILVDVLLPPSPFSLGSDTILCTGNQIEFNFDPTLGNFTWQDGTNGNTQLISTEGTYSLTISNMCGVASDAFQVTEIAPDTLNPGIDEEVLCNGEFLNIILDSTHATFLWQDGSSFANYHIVNAGLYTVTMTHACGISHDSILVSTYSTPSFELGDIITACPDDTIVLAVNGIMGNYVWQDGSADDSLTVTSPGTYSLAIDNACGSDTDSVIVEFESVMMPTNLGPDISLCPGESITLQAGLVNAQYLWQDLSTSDTLVVSTAGIYHITVSNSCYQFTDTVLVSLQNNPPAIQLPPELTLCEGSTEILNPGVAGVTFSWSDGSQDPTLTITNPGEYSLTIANACGTDIDTIQILDGGPLPTVSLGPDTSLCPGEQIFLVPTFTTVDTWLWQDGSISTGFTISDSGIVSVIVGNECGLTYDTLHVGLLEALPALDLGTDTFLCPGESLTLSISEQNVNILWSDGSTGSELTLTSAGIISASIRNACGISFDTIRLDVIPAIPVLDLGPDIPLCPAEQIILDPGMVGVAYLWQDGSVSGTYLADHAQEIILSISNPCGTSTDTLEIILNTHGPEVELGPDIRACEGNTVTIETHMAGVEYVWQDGSTDATFTTSVSGNFFVQVTNQCGVDIDTIGVDIHGTEPQPSLGPDTIICEGTTLTFISNADAETTLHWQDGTTLPTLVVTTEGEYILTESNFCGAHADSIFISFQPLPAAVDLGQDTILCSGETLLLTAPGTTDQISWHDGSTGTSLLLGQAGTYSLTISNECGINTDELVVAYDDRLIEFPVDNLIPLCPGESVEIDVIQEFAATYIWSTGDANAAIEIITPGEYAVTVQAKCQEASHEFIIIPGMECHPVNEFFVPNIFSPNHDQINDIFGISTNSKLEIFSMSGFIYDRWGNLIFSSQEIPFTWNGRYGNDELLPGIYIYAIEFAYELQGKTIHEKLKGNVTLVK